MPELAFVVGSQAPSSLSDLVEALAAEVSRQDAVATVVGAFPEPRADRVVVLFDDEDSLKREPGLAEQGRTIAVLTTSPFASGFPAAADLARRSGMAFHVNSIAVEHLLREGVPVRHLQLGISSDWPERDPHSDGLVKITGDGFFDWVLALAAIHRGEVVLHERCLGLAPLVAGRHVFLAAPESMELVADVLRNDVGRLEEVSREATEFTRIALPLALAAAALIGAARAAVAQPFAASGTN